MDGLLSIQCSPADDAIAIRLDPAAGSIQVLDDNELIGHFSSAVVDELSIAGLEAGDLVAIDSRLALPLSVQLVDGGIPLMFVGSTVSGLNLRPVNQSLNLEAPDSSLRPLNSILSTSASLVVENDSVELASSLHRQLDQVASLHHERVSLVTATADQNADLQARDQMPTGDDDLQNANQALLPTGGIFSNPDSGKDGLHGAESLTAGIAVSVASERLFSPSTGKSAAVADAGESPSERDQQRFASGEVAQAVAIDNALAETAFWQALRAEVLAQTSALTVSGDDTQAGDHPLIESPWRVRLRIAGISLAAAGVAFIPLVWSRRRDEEQAIDLAMGSDFDWFGGRFRVEVLRP